MTAYTADEVIRRLAEAEPSAQPWGELRWLIGGAAMPEARQTFGVVTIASGRRNPLHRHPNCEELLYVLSGTADHQLGDSLLRLGPGDVIRIPEGVPHWAKATSAEPLVAVIAFSSADRQTENLENADDLA